VVLVPPRPRQGYYISGGVYGVLDANWDRQRWYKGWPGAAGGVRLGQNLYEWLSVGIGVDFGWATGTKRQATFGGLSLEGRLHPVADLGVRAAVGFGVLSATELQAEASDAARGGVGDYYTLGVSYDFFPFGDANSSGGVAFTPVVQVRVLPRNEFNAMLAWVGIEVTWWLGLPSNQLELGLEDAFSRD
jgi:hypothetical protein